MPRCHQNCFLSDSQNVKDLIESPRNVWHSERTHVCIQGNGRVDLNEFVALLRQAQLEASPRKSIKFDFVKENTVVQRWVLPLSWCLRRMCACGRIITQKDHPVRNCRNCSDLAVDRTRCAVAGHDNCQQTAVAPLCGGARRDSGGH